MVLCGKLRAALSIDQCGGAVREHTLGRFRRRLAIECDLQHVAGPEMNQSAGQLSRATGKVGEARHLGRWPDEFIRSRYSVPAQVQAAIG